MRLFVVVRRDVNLAGLTAASVVSVASVSVAVVRVTGFVVSGGRGTEVLESVGVARLLAESVAVRAILCPVLTCRVKASGVDLVRAGRVPVVDSVPVGVRGRAGLVSVVAASSRAAAVVSAGGLAAVLARGLRAAVVTVAVLAEARRVADVRGYKQLRGDLPVRQSAPLYQDLF